MKRLFRYGTIELLAWVILFLVVFGVVCTMKLQWDECLKTGHSALFCLGDVL